MTQNLFPFAWEIFVNAIETALFLYLIHSKLTLRRNFSYLFPFSFLFFTLLISLLNYFHISFLFSFFFIFALNILYAVLFFENSFLEKLFWGSIYTIIKLFAEKFAFWLASIIFISPTSEFLLGGNQRMSILIIYPLICFAFVLFFMKMRNKPFSLPKNFQIVLILLMTLSIYIADSLLSLIMAVSSSSSHIELLPTLNRINYFFLFLVFSVLFMIKWIGSIYNKNMELLEEMEQEKAERQQFEILAEATQTLREWKHDYKNNLGVISLLMHDGREERAISFIQELLDSDVSSSFKLSSGNSVLDAIVSTKITSAKKLGIDFEHMVFLPPNIPLSAFDFSTIMGNFLDNAIEACGRLDSAANPYVKLTIKPYLDMLYIEISNSSNGNYKYNPEGKLISSKTEKGHGIGVRRSLTVVEKYHGIYQQLAEKDKFTITIMFPLSYPKDASKELTK